MYVIAGTSTVRGAWERVHQQTVLLIVERHHEALKQIRLIENITRNAEDLMAIKLKRANVVKFKKN